MNKLEMAHDWFMKHATGNPTFMITEVELSWKYADLMQAEADKREDKTRPAVLEEEWQPDWSQAPDKYKWWAVDKCGDSYFYSFVPYTVDDRDYWADHDNVSTGSSQHVDGCFNYQGDWRNSLRKRPE